jgi:hypothetical protein
VRKNNLELSKSSKRVVRQEKFVQNSGDRSLNWKKNNIGDRIDLFIY